ncbi:alpha/beta fold hydrolase [Alcaligenes faecalis]|uniref:alpha/beta fold hydrolase n=1 Tax=Alcaligenes faecalis TaxID=511 RepID=UPI0029338957|nr:alpha/beta fold hydrolase [Alcaligenes faecalis]MDV2116976.1 alpha/beta fold hydrolase [Alcaligenes faecalis]
MSSSRTPHPNELNEHHESRPAQAGPQQSGGSYIPAPGPAGDRSHSFAYECQEDTDEVSDSLTFVLVHGAWHGGWCWSRLAARLQAKGHKVYTPTLTGLGERSHLLNPDITLNTFVDDVANLIRWEELSNVIVVGHSFGGLVISGVADVMPRCIRHLIYLDAFILPNGTSTFDTLPEKMVESMIASAGQNAIPAVPPPPLSALGLHATEDLHFVGNRLTPQPLSVYGSSLRLQNPVIGNGRPCSYISCTQPTFRGVDTSREWARQQKDWEFHELECGHSAAITHPDMLARLLLELAD